MFHLSLVEPGGFRTDFAGRSLQQAREPIADYADTAGRRRKEHDTYHGTQPGDPARAAQAIITAVEAKRPSLTSPPRQGRMRRLPGSARRATQRAGGLDRTRSGHQLPRLIFCPKPRHMQVCEDRSHWHAPLRFSIERKGNPLVLAPGPRAPLRPCDVRCRSLGRRRHPPKRADCAAARRRSCRTAHRDTPPPGCDCPKGRGSRGRAPAGSWRRPPPRSPDRASVLDDKPEVASIVRRLSPPFGERQKLVPHVDERHLRRAATQLELEEASVEGERLLEVSDFQRDVVDANELGTCLRHSILLPRPKRHRRGQRSLQPEGPPCGVPPGTPERSPNPPG